MANLAIRKEKGGQIVGEDVFEPFNRMRELFRFEPWLRWDPFAELTALPALRFATAAFAPAFEVKETNDSYVCKADVPGIKEQDLGISLTGDQLSIKGKRESEKGEKEDTYYTYERSYGNFVRNFTVPQGVDVDHVVADLKDGVLTVVLPKRPEVMAKKVSIKSGEKEKVKA